MTVVLVPKGQFIRFPGHHVSAVLLSIPAVVPEYEASFQDAEHLP